MHFLNKFIRKSKNIFFNMSEYLFHWSRFSPPSCFWPRLSCTSLLRSFVFILALLGWDRTCTLVLVGCLFVPERFLLRNSRFLSFHSIRFSFQIFWFICLSLPIFSFRACQWEATDQSEEDSTIFDDDCGTDRAFFFSSRARITCKRLCSLFGWFKRQSLHGCQGGNWDRFCSLPRTNFLF